MDGDRFYTIQCRDLLDLCLPGIEAAVTTPPRAALPARATATAAATTAAAATAATTTAAAAAPSSLARVAAATQLASSPRVAPIVAPRIAERELLEQMFLTRHQDSVLVGGPLGGNRAACTVGLGACVRHACVTCGESAATQAGLQYSTDCIQTALRAALCPRAALYLHATLCPPRHPLPPAPHASAPRTTRVADATVCRRSRSAQLLCMWPQPRHQVPQPRR